MTDPHAEQEPLLPGIDTSKSPWPESPVSATLRAELLDRTTKLVRSRARSRRLRTGCGWAAAYAAGIASAWVAVPRVGPARRDAERPTVVAQIDEPRPTQGEDGAGNEPNVETSLPPEELRRRVADAPRPEQLRLLRLAGDKYLYGRADVTNALDCYRQILELTPHQLRAAVEPDDSWLLAELRLADQERPAD